MIFIKEYPTKKVMSDILQFKGSHYNFGVYQGELLKRSPLLKNRESIYKCFTQKFTVDGPHIKHLLNTFAPHITDEIKGLAYALTFTEKQALLHFAGYYAHIKSGRSITTNPCYMIRNYDNAPSSYDGRFVFFAPTDSDFANM